MALTKSLHTITLYGKPLTDAERRDLLIEWLGTRKIIRLAHKHGLYAKAAKARARQRQIEAIKADGWR